MAGLLLFCLFLRFFNLLLFLYYIFSGSGNFLLFHWFLLSLHFYFCLRGRNRLRRKRSDNCRLSNNGGFGFTSKLFFCWLRGRNWHNSWCGRLGSWWINDLIDLVESLVDKVLNYSISYPCILNFFLSEMLHLLLCLHHTVFDRLADLTKIW